MSLAGIEADAALMSKHEFVAPEPPMWHLQCAVCFFTKKAECHRPDMEDVLKEVDKQVGGALRRLGDN